MIGMAMPSALGILVVAAHLAWQTWRIDHHFTSETEPEAEALLREFARQKAAKGYVSTLNLGK